MLVLKGLVEGPVVLEVGGEGVRVSVLAEQVLGVVGMRLFLYRERGKVGRGKKIGERRGSSSHGI